MTYAVFDENDKMCLRRARHAICPFCLQFQGKERIFMKCARCGNNSENDKSGGFAASISGSIMGDEVTDVYSFCSVCGVYTVEACHDRFLGVEDISGGRLMSKEAGDERIRLIRRCSEPWEKKCRCDAHRAYFGGSLD